MAKGHKPTFRLIGKEPPVARKLLHKWDKLLIKDGVLYKKCQDVEGEYLQLVLPESMKQQVLDSLHNFFRPSRDRKDIFVSQKEMFLARNVQRRTTLDSEV